MIIMIIGNLYKIREFYWIAERVEWGKNYPGQNLFGIPVLKIDCITFSYFKYGDTRLKEVRISTGHEQ